jgi:hypothetical protein
MSVFLFIAGLVFVLGLGHVVVDWFLTWVRRKSELPTDMGIYVAGVPNWITGVFERSFAFVLVFANVPGTYVLLIAWMGTKLALNWKKQPFVGASSDRQVRVYSISALMAGTLSLGFGVIGGLIARGCN